MTNPKTERPSSRVGTARVEGGRVRLPQHLVPHLRWLQGSDPLDVWLLVAEIGRYSVLLEQDFARNAPLRELRDRIYQSAEVSDTDVQITTAETASWSARLLPTVLSPKGPGWRLSVPSEMPPDGLSEEGAMVYLAVFNKRLEMWSKQRLEELLRVPISKVLSAL